MRPRPGLAALWWVFAGCGRIDLDVIHEPDGGAVLLGADPCALIPPMPQPETQIVDGSGDEFRDVPGWAFDVATMPVVVPAPPPPVSASGVLRVAWSPSYFHAHVHMNVANTQPSVTDQLWRGDAIELFIAPPSPAGYDGSYSTTYDTGPLQIILSAPSTASQARAEVCLDCPITGLPATALSSAEYAGRLVADGYEFEVRLPWGRVTDGPASGKSIAFDFAVDVGSVPGAGGAELQGLLHETPIHGSARCASSPPAMAYPACDTRTWCTPTLQ